MASVEQNHEEWESIRTRADSLANAVFLIAGGALSLSISIMVSAKSSGVISEAASTEATSGWYYLLATIVLFVVLKFHMIGQAFLLHDKTNFADKYNRWLNALGWVWGVFGFGAFVMGLATLINAASMVVSN